MKGTAPATSPFTAGRLGALLALVMLSAPAWAVLGGGVADIQGEQLRLRATRSVGYAFHGGSVHVLRLPDSSLIQQFVNAQGIVYAVAWNTRLKPDFKPLLGRYAADFDAGVADARRTPGIKRNVFVDHGDLAVHSGGRLGSFVGKAWLKSQLPAGSTANEIR